MSGERPDFQQPTGITSQRGGVASAEEFAAQSDDIGVNKISRIIGAGNDILVSFSPGGNSVAVVIQRVFLTAEISNPSLVTLNLNTGVTTFTGETAEFQTTARQTPVSLSPGVFLAPTDNYFIRITNTSRSSAAVEATVVLRRVQ